MRTIFNKYRFAFLGLMLVVPALPLIFSFSVMEVKGDQTQMNDLRSDSAIEKSGVILSDLVGTETPDSPRNKSPDSNTVEAFVDSQLAKGKKPNRLIHEKSPYLLQHAFNPVDWYPWGEEAFRKARGEDKPIFLSIGYSTCHWCHVMAHESFENTQIATILNQYFVSIKVDREERPDLDRVYMLATQALTGQGGWPMSVFLTHDLKPFYAGTYFPAESRYGRPGFGDLLQAIHEAWANDRKRILQSATQITAHLKERTVAQKSETDLNESLLERAYNLTAVTYDRAQGGFSNAPKFPRPVTLNFLLRYHYRSGDKKALDMVLTTLRKMAAGGIHDQIGGGFHRYSVDGQWRVPHFEKMLYDQAQVAVAYLEAYQITNDSFYARVARDILDYVLRDLTGPHSGFYSAEDADSPRPENPEKHGEGAFYVFAKEEIEKTLGVKTGKVFIYYYGIEDGGNAPLDPQGEFAGKNILYVAHSLDETASQFGKSPTEIEKLLSAARQKLFQVRARRPRPHLDDKVITSWNGLMITALARGYQVLNEPRYLRAAEQSAGFITSRLYDSKQKVLLRRYRKGSAGLEAHLDDYAFLVQGLLDLYEASFSIKWLIYATALTDKQAELFGDPRGGGFYDTSGDDRTVLLRLKEDYEGAKPTGNSVAALNLLRLAQMTDNERWYRKGVETIVTFSGLLNKYPTTMPQMLVALDFQLHNLKQVIIAGKPNSEDTMKMLKRVHDRFLPKKVILLADGGEGQEYLSKYLPFIASMRMRDGIATAYVCENYTCKLPTTDVSVMVGLLES